MTPPPAGSLCGIWVDRGGTVHLSHSTSAGGRAESEENLQPFAWVAEQPAEAPAGIHYEKLAGEGVFTWLARAEGLDAFDALVKGSRGRFACDVVKPLESQHLLRTRSRLFAEVAFGQLRRCQLDIETASSDGEFSDADKPQDRVLAIGDSVRTDLKGAHAFGIDCLFITAGIHAEELGGRERPDPAALQKIFAAAGELPKAVMPRLVW